MSSPTTWLAGLLLDVARIAAIVVFIVVVIVLLAKSAR